jgi:hypothetical protein
MPVAGDTDAPRRERRARQSRLYTLDQVLGRAPIRLRRRSDKVRLVAHVCAAVAMTALIAWWVLPEHVFTGPVLFMFAPGRGVHLGDLPALVFLLVAARSVAVSAGIVRTTAS